MHLDENILFDMCWISKINFRLGHLPLKRPVHLQSVPSSPRRGRSMQDIFSLAREVRQVREVLEPDLPREVRERLRLLSSSFLIFSLRSILAWQTTQPGLRGRSLQ